MVAFQVFGWPIYWYGLLYLVSFVGWYIFLNRIGRRSWLSDYPHFQKILQTNLDDIMIALVLWVMIGWRLGDVFLYNRSYYSTHLSEIIAIRNGGMSFVWGIIWVVVAMFIIQKIKHLSWRELLLLLDCIVFILPFGILMGRIGNFLNQELYWKVVNLTSGFGSMYYELLYKTHLIKIFQNIDSQLRRNTNLLEWFFEGVVLMVWHILFFMKKLITGVWYIPWMISGWFCIGYWIIRFVLEILRDNPPSEYVFWLLKSQLLMIILVVVWVILIKAPWRQKDTI